MFKRILVTGGAGFIGSHIVDALIERDYKVRVLDNLNPQVHGPNAKSPCFLNKKVDFIYGDVRDKKILKRALKGIDAVFHEAAEVGVGQSMYEVSRYISVNSLGTAYLLEILASRKHTVKKLIIASSMSVYGEGAYRCRNCGFVYPKIRGYAQLKKRLWDMRCNSCGEVAGSVPTTEDKPPFPTSIYAITKRNQEEMCMNIGLAYNIPTVALRYFNVYGPRQALSNPYTGVAAIFSSRLLNKQPPIIFEDGLQSRDFVHISDIVRANILSLENKEADYQIFNVGTGRRLTVLDMANELINRLNHNSKPQIVSKYREGDIRHCYADITKIKMKLGFEPKVKFDEGIGDLINWVRTQLGKDRVGKAIIELRNRGLIK